MFFADRPSRGRISAIATLLAAALSTTSAHAIILEVVETGRRTTGTPVDAAAIVVLEGFQEDALAFSDRAAHQHNGAAYNPATGLLSTTGSTIVPLPDYLVGGDYVRFANNARNNPNYSATITTSDPADFYLLIDNRDDGAAGNNNSPNTTDPVLGGSLAWVVDDGWERVNTGLFPNDQADYTGVDEDPAGVGPGVSLNQFYAIYRLSSQTEVTLGPKNINGGNMYSLVVVPAVDPDAPIRTFFPTPISVLEGNPATLRWLIAPDATSATITGLGNVLDLTDPTTGEGEALVFPDELTEYTLTVEAPTGTDSRTVSVDVFALASFTRTQPIISLNGTSTLQWAVSPNAVSVKLEDSFGNEEDVIFNTNPDGTGSLQVSPQVDTTYTLTVTTPHHIESAVTDVQVRLIGRFTANPAFFEPGGGSTTLSWQGRPDATFTLSGVGPVTTEPDGTGTANVSVTGTATYTLTAETPERTENLDLTVRARPEGTPFALLDIGATGGTVQTGAANNAQIGAGAHNVNNVNLVPLTVTADTGETFTIAIDNISATGAAVGALDWRDRGNSTVEFGPLAEDFVKNNTGVVRVVLNDLPAGNYDIVSVNIDADHSQSSTINILVADADRPDPVDTGVLASAFWPVNHIIPGVPGMVASDISTRTRLFPIRSDGGQIRIIFDGRGGSDDETPLNGLYLIRTDGVAPPARILAFDYDQATRDATLTFSSTPGESYRIEASDDLEEWEVLAASHPAEAGSQTTFAEPNPGAPHSRRFYRVRRN